MTLQSLSVCSPQCMEGQEAAPDPVLLGSDHYRHLERAIWGPSFPLPQSWDRVQRELPKVQLPTPSHPPSYHSFSPSLQPTVQDPPLASLQGPCSGLSTQCSDAQGSGLKFRAQDSGSGFTQGSKLRVQGSRARLRAQSSRLRLKAEEAYQ